MVPRFRTCSSPDRCAGGVADPVDDRRQHFAAAADRSYNPETAPGPADCRAWWTAARAHCSSGSSFTATVDRADNTQTACRHPGCGARRATALADGPSGSSPTPPACWAYDAEAACRAAACHPAARAVPPGDCRPASGTPFDPCPDRSTAASRPADSRGRATPTGRQDCHRSGPVLPGTYQDRAAGRTADRHPAAAPGFRHQSGGQTFVAHPSSPETASSGPGRQHGHPIHRVSSEARRSSGGTGAHKA